METDIKTDVIYTYFSKKFDSINYLVLIEKLRLYGLSGPLISWVSSYLTD